MIFCSCRATTPSRKPVQLWALEQRTWSCWAQTRSMLQFSCMLMIWKKSITFVGWLVFSSHQRESHSCWFGSQSNQGQAKGRIKLAYFPTLLPVFFWTFRYKFTTLRHLLPLHFFSPSRDTFLCLWTPRPVPPSTEPLTPSMKSQTSVKSTTYGFTWM